MCRQITKMKFDWEVIHWIHVTPLHSSSEHSKQVLFSCCVIQSKWSHRSEMNQKKGTFLLSRTSSNILDDVINFLCLHLASQWLFFCYERAKKCTQLKGGNDAVVVIAGKKVFSSSYSPSSLFFFSLLIPVMKL